jgi:hypothetical protein
MKWDYDNEKSVWNLLDNTSIIARIFVREKPDQKRKFRTKALVASVYFGAQTFNRLTKRNKEWKVNTRTFHSREEMERYLDEKKKAIIAFIEKI